jgi:hypothetical protein
LIRPPSMRTRSGRGKAARAAAAWPTPRQCRPASDTPRGSDAGSNSARHTCQPGPQASYTSQPARLAGFGGDTAHAYAYSLSSISDAGALPLQRGPLGDSVTGSR